MVYTAIYRQGMKRAVAVSRYTQYARKSHPYPHTKPYALRFGIGGVHGIDVSENVIF